MKKLVSHSIVAFLKLLSHLPFWLLYGVADVLYLIVYHVVGYRKKVVRMNLASSFPNKTERERRQIEHKFYRHLADLIVEIIKYRTMTHEQLLKRCKVKNLSYFKDIGQLEKSLICIQGHYCNWEWPTYINGMMKQRVLSVYKPLHNEVEDKFLIEIRERIGALTVPKNRILRVLARRIKNKELSAVGLLSDQVPDDARMAHWMPFLNHEETPVFLGAEKMAKMFDMPIFFLKNRKVKRGHYEIEFIPVTLEPKTTTALEITEKHVRMTEQMILEQPEYWMWSHRRWKRKRSDV